MLTRTVRRSRSAARATSTMRFDCCRRSGANRSARCMRSVASSTTSPTTLAGAIRAGCWTVGAANWCRLRRHADASDRSRAGGYGAGASRCLTALPRPHPRRRARPQRRRYATFDELYEYCYLVASTVGLVCIEIFGHRHESARDYAVDLGVAFQLTNILRDVMEDADAAASTCRSRTCAASIAARKICCAVATRRASAR